MTHLLSHPRRVEMVDEMFDMLCRPHEWIEMRWGHVHMLKRTRWTEARLSLMWDLCFRFRGHCPWGLRRIRDALDGIKLMSGSRPIGRPRDRWHYKKEDEMKLKEPPKPRGLPISVRFPPDVLEELKAYAARVGADRSYVIVECVRRFIGSDREWRRERAQAGHETPELGDDPFRSVDLHELARGPIR